MFGRKTKVEFFSNKFSNKYILQLSAFLFHQIIFKWKQHSRFYNKDLLKKFNFLLMTFTVITKQTFQVASNVFQKLVAIDKQIRIGGCEWIVIPIFIQFNFPVCVLFKIRLNRDFLLGRQIWGWEIYDIPCWLVIKRANQSKYKERALFTISMF